MSPAENPDADGRDPAPPQRGTLTAGLSLGAASFIINMVVSLLTSVLIARLYGVTVVGQFALAFAPTGAVWLLSTVREQPAFQRRAAVLPPRHPTLTGLFAAVFVFSTGLTVVTAAVAAVVTYFLFHGPIHHPDLFGPAMVSLAGYTVFTNTCVNLDSIFVAFRDGQGLFWLRLNQSLVYLAMIIVGSFISRSVWTLVVTGILLWFFPCIHRLMIVGKWLRFKVPQEEIRDGFTALPEVLRFGLKLTPAGLLWGTCDQVGIWVLGAASSIPAVGAYSRASSLTDRFGDARQRLSELLFPTLVERRITGDEEGFNRALIDSIRYSTALMLLFAAAGGGAANAIMAVFGPGFTRASTALVFLLFCSRLHDDAQRHESVSHRDRPPGADQRRRRRATRDHRPSGVVAHRELGDHGNGDRNGGWRRRPAHLPVADSATRHARAVPSVLAAEADSQPGGGLCGWVRGGPPRDYCPARLVSRHPRARRGRRRIPRRHVFPGRSASGRSGSSRDGAASPSRDRCTRSAPWADAAGSHGFLATRPG